MDVQGRKGKGTKTDIRRHHIVDVKDKGWTDEEDLGHWCHVKVVIDPDGEDNRIYETTINIFCLKIESVLCRIIICC